MSIVDTRNETPAPDTVTNPVRSCDEHETEIATLAGSLNLTHAALTRTIADAIEHNTWGGTSPTQWLTYRAGITTRRATMIVAIAGRRHLYPNIIARFDTGHLSVEQVHELLKAPPAADAAIEHWGTLATPARIRRSIKHRYGPTTSNTNDTDDADTAADPTTEQQHDQSDRLTAGITDGHRFAIHGDFDLDSGQTINNALLAAREQLWNNGQTTITQADCLREICHRYLDPIDSPLRRDRARVWIHIDTTGTARTPTGIRIPDHTRDKISCDATIQPVWETNGLPFSIGRTHHSVPERTRRIIMLRDQGCRVPGCTHDRIIEIHHIIHWANGGPTDTWNLVALCAHHHRQHHHGQLDITGNADQPNGLTFTNHRGQPLHPTGPPTPPTKPPQPDTPYQPPRMEPVNWDWVGTSWPDP